MNPVCAVMVPHPPLIIPEIGRGEENKIQKTIDSYMQAARIVAEAEPDTIIITTPHSILYTDYFHISPGVSAEGSFAKFGAGQVKFKVNYDTVFVEALCRAADEAGLSAGTMGERDKALDHAAMVPLYFFKNAYGGKINVPVVRIGLSGLPYADHYKLGKLISETADRLNKKIAIVASGDLSHHLKDDGPYGFKVEGPQYDERIMKTMENGNFGELLDYSETFCESAGECGHRSFVIMAGCFDGLSVKSSKLSYEGPFGVGYGVCTFIPEATDNDRRFLETFYKRRRSRLDTAKQREDEYVKLARRSLEAYVKTGKPISVPDGLPPEMLNSRAGTFVSLHMHGQLRGCIGTISAATENIAQEIIDNAVSACSRDPRFESVRADELDELEYSVDVLGEAEKINSQDELDVKRYGVIVTSGRKRGLLLPNLDGVDTVEEQISIARKKGGVRDGEQYSLQRFEVVRHF